MANQREHSAFVRFGWWLARCFSSTKATSPQIQETVFSIRFLDDCRIELWCSGLVTHIFWKCNSPFHTWHFMNAAYP
jgi:hypothetical protein